MARRVISIPAYDTSDETVTYPSVIAHLGDLRGPEGNAYVIVGRVSQALRKAGESMAAENYSKMAFDSRSYEELLTLTRSLVRCIETGIDEDDDW